jgi:hypothetical protein
VVWPGKKGREGGAVTYTQVDMASSSRGVLDYPQVSPS